MRENEIKELRLRRCLAEHGYDAALIGRLDDFAWFTGGGNAMVVAGSENAFGIIIVTPEGKNLVAQVMDGGRIMEEELAGQGFTYVPLRMVREEL